MPSIEIEFSGTKTVEVAVSGTVEANVPQSVIDEDAILDWFDDKYSNDAKFTKLVDTAMNEDDQSEEVEFENADNIS